jgi:tetratricopeptide (TPR) repeat protein
MRRFLLLLALCLGGLLPAAPAPTEAEAAYARGDYATAIDQWKEQGEREGVTAGLLSALGNAEWRLGRKGRAVLCWERALLLNPRDPVALAGLRHAHDLGGAERPVPTWAENYAALLGADTWLVLAFVSFWTAVACLVVPRVRRVPGGEWNQRALLASATLLLLAGPGLWGAHTHAQRAVVRRTEVSLRLTPTALGEPLVGVAEGDVVRTERVFNGHWRVRTADGKVGWVRTNEVERIWGGGLPSNLDQKESP